MKWFFRRMLSVCVCGFAAVGMSAERVPPPRFTATAEIAPLRLLIPVPSDVREVPRKPVALTRYRVFNGREAWIEDRAPGQAFWSESQFASCWVDRGENVVTLARMLQRLPSALAQTELTREAYEAAMDDETLNLDRTADETVLAEWMTAFCQLPLLEPPRLLRINTSRLAKLYAFAFEDPRVRAYAFRLNPRYPGQAKAPRNWFALIVYFAHPPDGSAERVLAGDLLSKIRTTSAFEGTRARPVRQNRSRNPAQMVIEGPARERARQSIRYLSTWWFMESPHYIMLSDHHTAERFAASILGDLEAVRTHFEAAVPMFDDATNEVGVVRLFEHAEDYMGYVGDTISGLDVAMTGGMFDGRRRELVVRPAQNLTAQSEGSLRSVIKHEGFHQYLFSAFGGIMPSPWFNEGFAVFFEHCEIDRNGRIQVHESKRHTEQIEQLLDQPDTDWEALLSAHMMLDYGPFYADPELNYALAYGLIYYLMRGAPMERNQPHAWVLPTYREELARTADSGAATETVLADLDMLWFSRRFTTFWKTVKSRQDAKRRAGL